MNNMKNRVLLSMLAIVITIACFNIFFSSSKYEQINKEPVSQDEQAVTIIGGNDQTVLSEAGVNELISTVFSVAGDLSFETQICVTQVLLNRLHSAEYPSTFSLVLQEFNNECIRETEFAPSETFAQHCDLINEARKITKEAVNSTLSCNPNIIKLPDNVTIISLYDLDRFDEWTSDCVDGLRFYYE